MNLRQTVLVVTSGTRQRLHLLPVTQEDPPPQAQRVNKNIQQLTPAIQTTLPTALAIAQEALQLKQTTVTADKGKLKIKTWSKVNQIREKAR